MSFAYSLSYLFYATIGGYRVTFGRSRVIFLDRGVAVRVRYTTFSHRIFYRDCVFVWFCDASDFRVLRLYRDVNVCGVFFLGYKYFAYVVTCFFCVEPVRASTHVLVCDRCLGMRANYCCVLFRVQGNGASLKQFLLSDLCFTLVCTYFGAYAFYEVHYSVRVVLDVLVGDPIEYYSYRSRYDSDLGSYYRDYYSVFVSGRDYISYGTSSYRKGLDRVVDEDVLIYKVEFSAVRRFS